ncbi:hypothetical protein ASPCAL09568 [Aspergillus calidoustus]|uniref:Small secreted protein n=1 Tax=Aspergillus calidoustus TaxID=454130 RepID=A0A0U5GX82_ASPCI|nr:hypothetical protein ASPCAL09568 [Aspergillus calidoustus]
MQLSLTTLLLAALAFTSSTLAAPAPAPSPAKSMMVANTSWTISSLKRVCYHGDTKCTWTFGVSTGSEWETTTANCTYIVEGTPASQAHGGPAPCGIYTISSAWSGQFGADAGFTTLSVVNEKTRQIVWPAYTDKQLERGEVVTPDQSYTPSLLP